MSIAVNTEGLFVLVRIVDFMVLGLALIGLCICCYSYWDNGEDKRLARRRGRNGYFELGARVGMRWAKAGILAHLLFAYLGWFAVTIPPAPSNRLIYALEAGIIWILIQISMVIYQLGALLDRLQLRAKLRKAE